MFCIFTFTFTIKINHSCRKISHTLSIWDRDLSGFSYSSLFFVRIQGWIWHCKNVVHEPKSWKWFGQKSGWWIRSFRKKGVGTWNPKQYHFFINKHFPSILSKSKTTIYKWLAINWMISNLCIRNGWKSPWNHHFPSVFNWLFAGSRKVANSLGLEVTSWWKVSRQKTVEHFPRVRWNSRWWNFILFYVSPWKLGEDSHFDKQLVVSNGLVQPPPFPFGFCSRATKFGIWFTCLTLRISWDTLQFRGEKSPIFSHSRCYFGSWKWSLCRGQDALEKVIFLRIVPGDSFISKPPVGRVGCLFFPSIEEANPSKGIMKI